MAFACRSSTALDRSEHPFLYFLHLLTWRPSWLPSPSAYAVYSTSMHIGVLKGWGRSADAIPTFRTNPFALYFSWVILVDWVPGLFLTFLLARSPCLTTLVPGFLTLGHIKGPAAFLSFHLNFYNSRTKPRILRSKDDEDNAMASCLVPFVSGFLFRRQTSRNHGDIEERSSVSEDVRRRATPATAVARILLPQRLV